MTLRKTKRTEKRFRAGLPWTEAEVARLQELYPKTGKRDLAVRFGRPVWGIIGKARALGLKKDNAGSYQRQSCINPVLWSGHEEEMLRILFPFTPNEEIAEILRRSLDAVHMKSRKLGLRKMELWTETEDRLLKELYRTLSYEQLAKELGRSRSAVQIRVITLGLERKVANWADEEIDCLQRTYSLMMYQTIAKRLGRTWKAVAAKADKMGFTKNLHWHEADIQKLKQLYARFTARQVAERMGRSYDSVRNQIRLLSLRKRKSIANKTVDTGSEGSSVGCKK